MISSLFLRRSPPLTSNILQPGHIRRAIYTKVGDIIIIMIIVYVYSVVNREIFERSYIYIKRKRRYMVRQMLVVEIHRTYRREQLDRAIGIFILIYISNVKDL